jgi:DNA-binding MarR family transcriptional regulator
MVSTEWYGATEASAPDKGSRAISLTPHADAIEEVVAAFDALMHRLADNHAPEFLEIAITMPQAKLLYLIGAAGELHMSEIVARLGVSLSTVSGLVDRLVDHGLATRREDAADRRQVVVRLTPEGATFIDRFRELNARQMRELLARLDATELDQVRAAFAALDRAAARGPAPTLATTALATTALATTAMATIPASVRTAVTRPAGPSRKDPA